MTDESKNLAGKMEVIIGIDPGSRFTGYGIVGVKDGEPKHLAHGVIQIPATLSFAQKLNFLADQLRLIYQQYQPQQTVVEKIFLGKNADSAFKLGHVRGVCLQAAVQAGSLVFEYAARSVKKSVTGSGSASKDHVRLVIGQLLSIKTQAALDATDALALVYCHCRHESLKQLQSQLLRGADL